VFCIRRRENKNKKISRSRGLVEQLRHADVAQQLEEVVVSQKCHAQRQKGSASLLQNSLPIKLQQPNDQM